MINTALITLVVMRLVMGLMVVFVTGVRDVGHISLVAVNVVLDRLDSAVRQKNMVRSMSMVAVSLLVVAKMNFVVAVFDIVAKLVVGWVVMVVLVVMMVLAVMVICPGHAQGADHSNRDNCWNGELERKIKDDILYSMRNESAGIVLFVAYVLLPSYC